MIVFQKLVSGNTTLAPIGASLLPFTNPFTLNDGGDTITTSPVPELPHTTPTLQPNGRDECQPQYIQWQPPETWIVYADHVDGGYSSEDEMKEPRGG